MFQLSILSYFLGILFSSLIVSLYSWSKLKQFINFNKIHWNLWPELLKFSFPLLISGFLIYNICDYFCIGIDIAERTEIRMYSGLAALFTNIVLNLILIPIFGGIGAAAATLISYFLYGIILMFPSSLRYISVNDMFNITTLLIK